MILRAWMRFSSHFSVSASEYSGSNPDLTHFKISKRISYETGLLVGRDAHDLTRWRGVV
jgi:hypothetical protein